jgi:hypothetical protein
MHRSVFKLILLFFTFLFCVIITITYLSILIENLAISKPLLIATAVVLFVDTACIGTILYHRHTVKLFARIHDIYTSKVVNPLKEDRNFSTRIPKFQLVCTLTFSIGSLLTSAFLSYELFERMNQSYNWKIRTEDLTLTLIFLAFGIWTLIDLKTTDSYLRKHQFLKKDDIDEIGSIRID